MRESRDLVVGYNQDRCWLQRTLNRLQEFTVVVASLKQRSMDWTAGRRWVGALGSDSEMDVMGT